MKTYEVQVTENLLCEVDGSERHSIEEPVSIYCGDSLERAKAVLVGWEPDKPTYDKARHGIGSITYQTAELLEIPSDDAWIVTLDARGGLPDSWREAWRKTLRQRQRYLDFEDDAYETFGSVLGLAD